ncbi:hypothetical protein T484DRAFT_1965010 [Baffinella frigidus]|nr:hypothetical protein T484DRAFT_1965010 [Cryptophyta sp. CCMP2293]
MRLPSPSITQIAGGGLMGDILLCTLDGSPSGFERNSGRLCSTTMLRDTRTPLPNENSIVCGPMSDSCRSVNTATPSTLLTADARNSSPAAPPTTRARTSSDTFATFPPESKMKTVGIGSTVSPASANSGAWARAFTTCPTFTSSVAFTRKHPSHAPNPAQPPHPPAENERRYIPWWSIERRNRAVPSTASARVAPFTGFAAASFASNPAPLDRSTATPTLALDVRTVLPSASWSETA